MIGVNLLLINSHAATLSIILGLVPLLLHIVLLLIFNIYHFVREIRTEQIPDGVTLWVESHHRISVFRNVFYVLFVVLIFVGFVGLALSSSAFSSEEIENDNQTYYGDFLLKQQDSPVTACQWKFHSFNIQDMALLAALAYR